MHFDEATHTYTIGGKPVPSVTQTLREAGLIDATWYSPEAAQRGTFVHQACALYDRDELDMDALDPVLSPYVEAWAKFRHQSQVQLAIIEQPYFSLEHGFAGTVDRAWLEGKHFVICDIKSGPLPSWLSLQLAGYSILINAFSGMGVELKDNGKYSVKVIKTPELFRARRLFLEALAKVKKERAENGTQESYDGSDKPFPGEGYDAL
jgi:hypothetical protein